MIRKNYYNYRQPSHIHLGRIRQN